MSNSVSPVVTFLTSAENIPHVLEILSYGEEIRDSVLGGFSLKLEAALTRMQPDEAKEKLRPVVRISNKSQGVFAWDFFLNSASSNKGIKYRIEIYAGRAGEAYFGIGLSWDVELDSHSRGIPELQAVLKRTQSGDLEDQPQRNCLWWKYLKKPLHEDLWVWLAGKNFESAESQDELRQFWKLVSDTLSDVEKVNAAI